MIWLQAAAKTTVLLKNKNGVLPLGTPRAATELQGSTTSTGLQNNTARVSMDLDVRASKPSIAVIGPFARCDQGLCYAHDYAGTPSFTHDFVFSITKRAKLLQYPPVQYAQGTHACSLLTLSLKQ